MSTASTMTDEEFDTAVRAAIAELRNPKPSYEEKLADAGDFVVRFGTLGDIYDEPGLTQLQMAGPMGSAWDLIGHWSVSRNDGGTVPAGFSDHEENCQTCFYLEGVLGVIDVFTHTLCETCGRDLDAHDVVPDHNVHAVAVCRPVWVRQEPLVGEAGDAAPYQVSDAFDARWVAPLSDGTFALISRTYYIAHNTDDAHRVNPAGDSPYERHEPFVERQDEYLVCRDPADPGGTEINATYVYRVVESDDPTSEDPRALAADAPAPEEGEWIENTPELSWSHELLPAGA